MPVSGGGFEQAYNAQASVDMKTMLIVGNHVSQNPNDKQEVEPTLAQLNQLPKSLGQVERAALDAGFFSEHNTDCFEAQGIEPYIAAGRQTHNLSRFGALGTKTFAASKSRCRGCDETSSPNRDRERVLCQTQIDGRASIRHY